VLIVTLRPGLYPTEEASLAIQEFLLALSGLMNLHDA
jgi:hypothetical protein